MKKVCNNINDWKEVGWWVVKVIVGVVLAAVFAVYWIGKLFLTINTKSD